MLHATLLVAKYSEYIVSSRQNTLEVIMTQNDNINIAEKNIIGAIDRLATNIALAGLAIIPSCLIVIFMPWRLTPIITCLLYTSPSPRDRTRSRMPSSA